MKKLVFLLFFTIATFTNYTAHAQKSNFSDAQKTEMNDLIESYLLENGAVILQSVTEYQIAQEKKERAEVSVQAKELVENLKKQDMPFTGNPKGDITIVEFFDYNCGYCRKALLELQTVLKEDKNVKVIFMDMPILGPPSMEAAKWSLAAHRQGKYFELHRAILEHNGPKNSQEIEKLAIAAGLDIKKLKVDKEASEITAQLEEYVTTARNLKINGTPAFIIEGEVFPGYIPASAITQAIEKARSAKK